MGQPNNSILIINHNEDQSTITDQLYAEAANELKAATKLETFTRRLRIGVSSTKVTTGLFAGTATGTITLASMVATDTVTVNGVTFTCMASGAVGNQFNVGGTDTLTAVALAAAINASATAGINTIVTATSALAVVTVNALYPGYLGNAVTLAISAHGSVSAARLAGGDNGALNTTHYYGSSS